MKVKGRFSRLGRIHHTFHGRLTSDRGTQLHADAFVQQREHVSPKVDYLKVAATQAAPENVDNTM